MDKQREGFEKAYEPNPNKSPFTEVKFDEVARVYKPLDQFNPRIASSLNAAWYGWRIRQAEVDGLQAKVEELQRRNQMLNDNIKEQGQKLVYQNEVIETQAEKLLGLRDEKAELQKRVDAALKETQFALQYVEDDMRGNHEFLKMAMIRVFKDLEQALKGEGTPKKIPDIYGRCDFEPEPLKTSEDEE